MFYWVFRAGTGLADPDPRESRPRDRGVCRSLCHVACPWRRLVRGGRAAIADLVEIDVAAATGFAQSPPTRSILANGSTLTESPPPVPRVARFTQISPATHERADCGARASRSTASTRHRPAPDPADALKDLFSQIDANGDGQISKTEFENALGAGGTNLAQADDVFNKLDTNGDGSVSLDEMQTALQGRTARAVTTIMSPIRGSTAHVPADRAPAPAVELRSAAAGAGRRNQHVGDQQ